MTNWIQSSLNNAVEQLRDVGLVDLAGDMQRLLQSGEVENLRIYRQPEVEALSEDAATVEDTGGLASTLRRTADAFRLANATVHVVSETAAITFNPRVVTTYPRSWISRYVERGYAQVDPVLAHARTSDQGFFWDELDRPSPMVHDFLNDAQGYGVGPSGYTLPFNVWHGTKIALSVTSKMEAIRFRETLKPQLSDLEILAHELVSAFVELAAEEFPVDRTPPERLLVVLRALARGDTPTEIGEKYGIGDMTVLCQEICEFYNARTLSQAAMICTRLNHLDGMTFDRWEIASEDPLAVEPPPARLGDAS
jgi:hypothetical protein